MFGVKKRKYLIKKIEVSSKLSLSLSINDFLFERLRRHPWLKTSITIFLISLVSQINAQSTKKVSESDKWGLNKYIWSHVRAESEKAIIDFDVINNWQSMLGDNEVCISRDGQYFAYATQKNTNLDTLVIQSINSCWRQTIVGINSSFQINEKNTVPGFFTGDSKAFVFKDKGDICLLQLGTEGRLYIKNVVSHKLAYSDKKEWLACLVKNGDSITVLLQNLIIGKQKYFRNVMDYKFDNSGKWLICQLRSDCQNAAKDIMIYNLESEKEFYFSSVSDFIFDENGCRLLLKMAKESNGQRNTSLQYITLVSNIVKGSKTEQSRILWSTNDTSIRIEKFGLDETGMKVAFILCNTESNKISNRSIGFWEEGMDSANLEISDNIPGVDSSMFLSDDISFVGNGRYVQFALHGKPDKPKSRGMSISMDVWSFKDKTLQPAQSLSPSIGMNYTAFFDFEKRSITRLPSDDRIVQIIGDYVLVYRSKKDLYGDRFWEKGYNLDSFWVISLQSGIRKYLTRSRSTQNFQVSPNGRFLVYCDFEKQGNIFSFDILNQKLTNISFGVQPFHFDIRRFDERTDEKYQIMAGLAGWLKDDNGVLIYDNYDIWRLDLQGKNIPINITNGYGVKNKILLSLMESDRLSLSNSSVIKNDTLILRAFNKKNKFNGFYRKVLGSLGDPQLLCIGPFFFDRLKATASMDNGMNPLKAADANVWIIKRQTPTDAPNYFVTNDFKAFQRLTNLQPHKKNNWLTTELHSFKQLDGTIGCGILYKPENFNPASKYPVIISFYASLTDQLYQFPQPYYITNPGVFSDPSWLVSHGYLVFVPDIHFIKNKWGPSTVNSIDGAARYLQKQSYVDGNHMAACGHSNSGRFGYYLLTHSKLFSAMSIGSGFTGTNVISLALSLDHYKGTTSNLEVAEKEAVGAALGNLWENKDSWIDHTAVLQADRATSPLLLFHNNKDIDDVRAAIELYISFRRLEKSIWWVQYDGGSHTVGGRDAQDFTIRYTQFFDHYLKNAPAPRWMTQGIPNKLKGIEARYELDAAGSCAMEGKTKCNVCEAWNKQYKRTPEMFKKPIREWKLDDDIQEKLDKKTRDERVKLDKQGLVEQDKIVDILKHGYPLDRKKDNVN